MSETEESVPRESRTPATDAYVALRVTREIWLAMITRQMAANPDLDYGELADPESYFRSEIFRGAWDDPAINGDNDIAEINLSFDNMHDPESYRRALTQVVRAIVAYAVQAVKAEMDDKHEEAWTYAVDAQYWVGTLRSTWIEKTLAPNPAAELARKRHAEHYDLTEEALAYWRENIDPKLSAAKAANVLVRVVPLSHKKLAEIVAAERKKLP